jgi:peptidoglycan/xylan/chitin deacetylase (PgdA/CDA1 family)
VRAAVPALISSMAALPAVYAVPATARFPAGRLVFPTITTVRTEVNAVALTFDDGPDEGLERFLGLLEEARARATFFVVGEQVECAAGRLEEIVACGHEVGVHCYRHRNHLRLTPRQITEDMRRAKECIEDVSGHSIRLFRPPYGIFNLASWREAGRQGWERVLWARWGKDWEQRATPYSIANEIGRPEAGDVLLLHDSDRYSAPGSWQNTLGALPIILERLSARELRILPVGELLGSREC